MAYSYIERGYGKRFEAGQRVLFKENDGDCGAHGTVIDNASHEHYVRVRFEDGHEGNCHPYSVEVVPALKPQSSEGAL